MNNQTWQERKRPARLERRYEFSSYGDLSDFLERAAELSEARDYYPNMGFGQDYLNVTIYAEEGGGELSEEQRHFADDLDGLQAGCSAA